MKTERIAAFTDAVIAIIMTILVLELEQPEHPTLNSILERRGSYFAYIISFLICAVFWKNHHHIFHLVRKINGNVLWANTFKLFTLSMLPYFTVFVDHNFDSRFAEMAYGISFITSDIAYFILCKALIKADPSNNDLRVALSFTWEAPLTWGILLVGFIVGIFIPRAVLISCLLSVLVWVRPNKRAEEIIISEHTQE